MASFENMQGVKLSITVGPFSSLAPMPGTQCSATLLPAFRQRISTHFSSIQINDEIKNVEVKQTLNTGSNKYPISYKLRKTQEGWKIVNIIIHYCLKVFMVIVKRIYLFFPVDTQI